MSRKQNSGTKTLFGVSIFMIAALGALVGYMKMGREAVSPKVAIDQAIKSAKKNRDLKPEQEALLKVQMAVLTYNAKNRIPPESLNDLVPTFLDSIPNNPKTSKPFYYKRDGRRFVLRGSEEEARGATLVAAKVGGGAGIDPKLASDPNGFVNPNTLEVDEFVYDPTGKRDPFRPFDLSKKVVPTGDQTPLELYSLGQLRLTAVLSGGDGNMSAIVENEAGRGFTVKVGTKIGDSNGVVVSIERDMLKILETTVDFAGVENQNVVEMKLYTKPAGDGSDRPEGTTYSGKRAPIKPETRRRTR